MRVRRAHDAGMHLARQREVVGERAAPGKKTIVFLASQRLSNPFLQAGQDKLNRCPTA
jgi:hypothetical protein